jgi:hypothetical protein
METPTPMDDERQREAVAWLSERSEHDYSSGFDRAGWPETTWVLHSIYEDPSAGYEATHDDLRRQRVAAGLEEPIIVNGVNLDEKTTLVGNSLGISGPVGVECVRLRWRELAARLSIDFDDNEWPPGFRWFPYRNWPVGLHGPDEGSLDSESLFALVDDLARHSLDGGSTRCVAYYAPLACGDFVTPRLREFQLDEVESLVDPAAGRVGTPSNWWPSDRAWMVYTDWDLWATKVSGTADLIDAIASDERLEAMQWPVDRGSRSSA